MFGQEEWHSLWQKSQNTFAQANPHLASLCAKKDLNNYIFPLISPAGFYVDCAPPEFCFVPCGHMASEKTVKYWASIPIPCGTSGFQVRSRAY